MERVLLEGTPFKGRPVVPNPVVSYPVVSYPSLSQFPPKFESARTKFESGRTQATDRFSPDFYFPYLFETPARAREQVLIVA